MSSPSNDHALEMLELAAVPKSSPPVYAIGLASSRITFADQQRRALNVVWALLAEGRVHRGDEIVVIGAGLAGVTAAAYALQHGVKVTLFEQFDEPFTIQQGSGRWVHPNVYEWPRPGWEVAATSFPVMNWTAGTANDVVRHLRDEWRTVVVSSDLNWRPRTSIVDIKGAASAGYVTSSGGEDYGPFAACILCIGFGEETAPHSGIHKPYWRDDDLHQQLRHGGDALVSGCGDSGLVDAIRIATLDFHHDWLASIASAISRDSIAVDQLLSIERNAHKYPDGSALTDAISKVILPDDAQKALAANLRPNTTVLLNSRGEAPFDRNSCMINRVVVSGLIKLGSVSFRAGEFAPSSIKKGGDKYSATIDADVLLFDLVVVRHGPRPPIADFKNLSDKLSVARSFFKGYSAGVDRTRSKEWMSMPLMTAPMPPSSTSHSARSFPITQLRERSVEAAQRVLVAAGILARVRVDTVTPNSVRLKIVNEKASARIHIEFTESELTAQALGLKGDGSIHRGAFSIPASESSWNYSEQSLQAIAGAVLEAAEVVK